MACVRLDVSVNLPADLLFLPLIVNFASPLRPHRTMRPAAKTYGMTRRALISILAFACTMTVPAAGVVPADIPTAVSRVDSMLVEARCHLGKRYKYGAAGSESFDCSGYTSYVFGRYGYKLARSSRGQAVQGRAVERDSLLPGDLVLFSGRRASHTRVGHVGIVVEVDRLTGDFRFIHASTSRGVIISSADERYYSQRYVCARRIVSLDDCKLPPVTVSTSVGAGHVGSDTAGVTFESMRIVPPSSAPAGKHSKRRARRR